MEYTTVRNNKDTDVILKSEKQEVTSGLLESTERTIRHLKCTRWRRTNGKSTL